MKVIIGTHVSNSGSPHWQVEIIPDSALLLAGKPLFLPDIKPEFSAGLAFRVGRLGKSIARKFAARYLDAMTICVRMTPTASDGAFSAEEIGCFCDNAVTLGEWTEIPPDAIAAGDGEIGENRFDVDKAYTSALDLLTAASRHSTIKMGDVVAVDLSRLNPQPRVNDILTGNLNNRRILHFRIK